MLDQIVRYKTRKLLNSFSINDKPAGDEMSDGQVDIAASIITKIAPRVACVGPTGYGKSEAISMGVIYRVVVFKEDFIIASVKLETSEIIMNKVIQHLFDDEYWISQLELEKDQELTRLRRERRKSHLTFKKGGSIKIVTLHGAEEDVSKAIGEHKANIILDESPLLTPGKYLQVLKILEGTGSYDKTFLFELGNAVNRNHFMQNVLYNPHYFKLFISLEQAIKEGRLDERSVEEKRGLPFFEQFYECKFPDEEEIDDKGYRTLITQELLEKSYIDDLPTEITRPKLGVDIGAGGDFNVYILRTPEVAWVVGKNQSNDTMTNVVEVERLIKEYDLIPEEDVFIDDTGIGKGVSDRLRELGYYVNAVTVGSKAQDETRFKNLKAEAYWNSRLWLVGGGTLVRHDTWQQLNWIKYKITTDKLLQIEPKDDLKKRTGKSPDFADALMLTFTPMDPIPSIRVI